MIPGERYKDELEQAEEWADRIASNKDGGQFPRVGMGGRGIIQVFLSRLRDSEAKRNREHHDHELRLANLERKMKLIDPEMR